MKVGDKVKVIEDCYEFKEGEIVSCVKVDDDGIHYFSNGKIDFWLEPYLYDTLKPKKDPIVKSVLKKYKQRSKVGIEKYGCTLERTDLTEEEWFEHLQFELMDATLYIERILKALHERK
jgi:hypothetical protein